MLVVEGVIEDIIFRNDVNGYTVAKLSTEDGLITIVGNAAIINIDEMVEVRGEWIYHDDFGEQLEFKSIKTVAPSTLKGIENYLGSGLLPYVGPKTAKNIVDKFGMDSLDIIQYNPEKLRQIPGIGDKKLEKISKAYEEHREIKDVMVYLQQFDITINLGIKIYKKYGKDTIKVISKNPYRLSQDVYGIGFRTADKIAKNMGISVDSPFRIEAGLKYVLMQASNEGHCYLPKNILINETCNILGLNKDVVENNMVNLALNQDFFITEKNNEEIVYTTKLHVAENDVAYKLVSLARTKFKEIEIDIDKEIDKVEKDENISFGKKQRLAISESLKSGVSVITGGPGTGKTTTVNAIIKIFEQLDMTVLLAAPTGRAAKRMTETSGKESKTIHRLLEFAYIEDAAAFNKDEDSPIEAEVLIIDEASMIDINLMNNLLKAVDIGTRLILVGDIDQLPSVGPGNVLKDIISSECVNVVELDEIFRQAEESMIVVNAHKINKGEFPILNAKNKDFYFLEEKLAENTLEIIVDLCKERLSSYYNINPINDIQVLTPMKKGKVGTKILNERLQEALNPKDKAKEEKKLSETIFRVGDKVMQIRNNYNLEWISFDDPFNVEEGKGVFNGDLGNIISIDHDFNTLTVRFDDNKEVEYDFKELDELQLAYASTIHKSQGSEFPVVVIPIEWGPPMLLTRNLIYTAITRARDLVVLVGDPKYLAMMISNNMIMKRYSTLCEKMKSLTKALDLDAFTL